MPITPLPAGFDLTDLVTESEAEEQANRIKSITKGDRRDDFQQDSNQYDDKQSYCEEYDDQDQYDDTVDDEEEDEEPYEDTGAIPVDHANPEMK